MEAAKEEGSAGLLDRILPPRLEDAGLEDCALSAESIHEAFLKAASAVKSRASTLFHSDDDEDPGCLQDPWPENGKDIPDSLTGVSDPSGSDRVVVGGVPDQDASGDCLVGKGGPAEVEGAEDKVIIGGDNVGADYSGGTDCVDDGLKGLSIGKEEGKKKGRKEDDEEEENPISVEGCA